MPVDTNAEIRVLRTVLRDLVALSAIPAALADREPAAVAAGLADALIKLLQLESVFVRLRVPSAAGAADVIRGTAWETFPEWLESHLAENGRLAGIEIIPDVGGAPGPCRGIAIPVGVNAEGGVVAAACSRTGFPTEIDRLLLGLAANHAATAFQNATLIHERTQAEQELRRARDVLETSVTQRTAELRRSEAYLSEAQRLTHTGTAALDGVTGEVIHSSDEHSRLYGFDPGQGVPSFEEFRQRVHPEDRARWTEALKRGISQAASVEGEFRVVPPGGPLKHLRAILHPVFTASGELDELMGTVVDVTERRRAQEEHQAQLWFLESMDVIDRAIQGTSDLEQMMGALARRSAVPVELDTRVETRLAEPVERTAYYIVSEALTNTAKHAHASVVHVAVEARDGVLGLSIRDDGCGGADPARGSGLVGLTDRVDALAGTIRVASPIGVGTTLLITLPLEEG